MAHGTGCVPFLLLERKNMDSQVTEEIRKPTVKLSETALTTLEDTLRFLGMDPEDKEVDVQVKNNIILTINAASAYIEKQAGRRFGRREYSEQYEGTGSQRLLLNNYPVKKIKEIKDLSMGRAIRKAEYYLENGGESGIIYRDDGWAKCGYPSGLANDLTVVKKNISVKYVAGYILPKDGTEELPSDLPYDLQYAVWMMVQQQWNLLISGAGGLSAFSISDVSWTFDKTSSPVVTDVVNKYMRWEC